MPASRVVRAKGVLRSGLLSAAAIIGLLSTAATAGDWPQVLGPTRNGLAKDESLRAPLPDAASATLWSKRVGSGFAGVAVLKGQAMLFHRENDDLVAERVDAVTGKSGWRITFPTTYVSGISPDNGPRCVPLLHAGTAYLLGPGGELVAAELDDGKIRWQRNLKQEFHAPEGYFGFGSSPIVEDDKLVLNVGGAPDAGIVAFSLSDGQTLWKVGGEAASYSSPVAATIDGQRQLVFVTRLNVVSLSPKDGQVRFRFPFGARGPTVNAATPLVLGDHLFVSASYGVGAQWAKITDNSASEVWANDDVMSSQYTTCVERDGILYGIDGRQDVGSARLRAFDPRTGKVLWTRENFGTGNLILVGDKLLIMRTEGELVVADASPEGFREQRRMQLFNTTVQALPALSDGLLLVRDTRTLKCLRIGEPVAR